MNYMGGKFRQGKKIAEVVARLSAGGGRLYYEPFCGAMGSAYQVLDRCGVNLAGSRLSDVSSPLITMWTAVLNGWEPPDQVTEEFYDYVKLIQDPDDPITAFVGFGLSFGGKYFGTFARSKPGKKPHGHDAGCAKRSCKRRASVLSKHGAKVYCCDYREVIDSGQIFYLDPPYHPGKGRNKCHDFAGGFDTQEFFEYARMLVALGNRVIVTGFDAPDDWRVIHSWGDTVVRHYAGKGSDGTCESIYAHVSQVEDGTFDAYLHTKAEGKEAVARAR